MPAYLHCPACLHPVVVPERSRGRVRNCRQCGAAFMVPRASSTRRNDRPASAGASPPRRAVG